MDDVTNNLLKKHGKMFRRIVAYNPTDYVRQKRKIILNKFSPEFEKKILHSPFANAVFNRLVYEGDENIYNIIEILIDHCDKSTELIKKHTN
jgi:hypothetical protein